MTTLPHRERTMGMPWGTCGGRPPFAMPTSECYAVPHDHLHHTETLILQMNNDDVAQRFAARTAEYTPEASHALFIQAVEHGRLEQSHAHQNTIRSTIHKRLIKYARIIKIAGAIISGIAVAIGCFHQSFVWKCIVVDLYVSISSCYSMFRKARDTSLFWYFWQSE